MRLLIVAFWLLAALPAAATELRLTEAALREVENDRFVARLEARVEAADPATAQRDLNALTAEALTALGDRPDLEIETFGYDVTPPRDEDGPEAWVARQQLALETADRAALLEAAGQLQALGLATRQLGARLSAEAIATTERALLGEAVAALRERAARAADAFDLHVVGWRHISLDAGGPSPRAMRADAAALGDAATPPSLTTGTTTVRVAVSATAELAPQAGR